MKFGIHASFVASPFTTRCSRRFPRFRAWGFDSVEIPVEDPALIDPPKSRSRLEGHGLSSETPCVCLGPDRDPRGSPRRLRTGLTYLRTLVDQAVELGSWVIVGPVYSAVGRPGRTACWLTRKVRPKRIW